MNCTVCGYPIPDGARFCPNCGSVVTMPLGTEERKMVTVLFADLVDSTGLAQRLDAERAREVLGRFFDVATEELQALRGRPEKFIGDAVMAVFGLPQVHEDDAVRAVRAGLAIRGRLRRLGRSLGLAEGLEVRVGIESGEAATGLGPAGQLLVTGPVVNAAARLQTAASPGEVLAGQTTHALTNAAVSFGDRREVLAKGFETKLAAFPVEGLTTRSVRRTIPFVGRGGELTILRECLGRAAASGRPVLATVIGESGIGKSRLADELIAGLDDDVTVLLGRARSYADTATFAPVAAIVSDLAGLDSDPPEKIQQRLRDLVDRTCEGEDVGRMVDRLSRLFGSAERGRDESTFVHDVQAGFTTLIDGLGRDEPVVLVFEDVQSLRPPMLDLIERLGARVRGGSRRSLTVALARPELLESRPAWGAATMNAVLLRLDPLSADEALELVRQAGGGRIGDAEAAEIATRTGGNPFFIVETTGMLLPGATDSTSPPRTTLPPTVQAVVSARLDALPPRLRELARRAAVFLYTFGLEELRLVDPDATSEELHLLEEDEIVVRSEGAGDPRWRLRHATLHDVAYASLPKRERLRLHDAIARNLETTGHTSWAADHFELAALASLDLNPADREPPDRAAHALVEAGHRARRRMESRSAIDRYERALGLSGPEDLWGIEQARALAGMGESRYWLGEYTSATESLERAVALGTTIDDPWTLALALRFLGDIAINVDGDIDEAEALLNRSLEAAERIGDSWVIVRTLLFAGWVPWNRDRFDEAKEIFRRALDIADEDDGWARVRALTALSITHSSTGENEEADRLIEQAAELADDLGDQFSLAVTSVQKGRVLEDLDRLEESLPWFDTGIATFEELGARWELADALAERGVARRRLDRLEEAEGDLQHAIRILEDLGTATLTGWAWRALALVAEQRGDHAVAEERFQRAREEEARQPR
jgi:class 3 adenylate cyclase/tetratricopeptide (TPR) repeat protein